MIARGEEGGEREEAGWQVTNRLFPLFFCFVFCLSYRL
jgi:hypothetical protein